MSILLEITSFCFSLMKNEIRDRLMMKYLSSRLGIFIFKYGPHPLPVKSQHVTIRVVVNMHWLGRDSLVIEGSQNPIQSLFFQEKKSLKPRKIQWPGETHVFSDRKQAKNLDWKTVQCSVPQEETNKLRGVIPRTDLQQGQGEHEDKNRNLTGLWLIQV